VIELRRILARETEARLLRTESDAWTCPACATLVSEVARREECLIRVVVPCDPQWHPLDDDDDTAAAAAGRLGSATSTAFSVEWLTLLPAVRLVKVQSSMLEWEMCGCDEGAPGARSLKGAGGELVRLVMLLCLALGVLVRRAIVLVWLVWLLAMAMVYNLRQCGCLTIILGIMPPSLEVRGLDTAAACVVIGDWFVLAATGVCARLRSAGWLRWLDAACPAGVAGAAQVAGW
jgi:hypothetical protein